MLKTILIGLVIVLFCVFALYWYEDEIRGYPAPWQQATASTTHNTGIANPASTNCVKLGGSLEIVDDGKGAGQIGMCHLKDGRVCEEWALFRGTCATPKQ